MEKKQPIIELKHIKKCYTKDVPVIYDFNLTINEGEFVTFLGPSGCGKTTILRMLAGFETPTSGEILFNGKDISELPPNERKFNTVFQKYALFPHLNIYDNISFGLKEKKVPKNEIKKKVKRVLEIVDLEGFEKRKIDSLSGGQQQRIAIARAIVNEPRILLLDEPLSALDYKMRQEMQIELKNMHKELGITFIFVTHDQDEAMSISDLIVVMCKGVVQQIGKPQDVYDDPANLFVAKFLGTPPINVFSGNVRSGQLLVGENPVLTVPGVPDQDVFVGIRPEGFIPASNGPLCCTFEGVEVMGRDISVVSNHVNSENASIRSIITAETPIDTTARTIRFSLKPTKVFLFEKESGKRIRFQNAD